MLAMMLMFALQDAPLPKLTLTSLGRDRYRIVSAPFPVSEHGDVDREHARIAVATCGKLPVGWGVLHRKGPVVGDRVPTYSVYTIEFECLAPDTARYPPVPDNWRPSAADEADVRTVFAKYFRLIIGGDFEGAYAMFDQRVVPIREGWMENKRTTNAALGRGTQRITAVHWEANPKDKRHPGAYATIVFDGDYPGADAACGEVTLYRRGAGDYVLTGEEFNFLSRGGRQMSAEEIAEAKRERCPR